MKGARLEVVDPLRRAGGSAPIGLSHGTAVASLLFGRHGSSVQGVAPACRGLIIPVYRDLDGHPGCSQADLALAIDEALRQGAQIINISGGEVSATDGTASPELQAAVERCAAKGALIVAAAGNDGCGGCLHVPGALPSVLVVGATDAHGQPLRQSNWAAAHQSPGIVAPGQDLLVAVPGGDVSSATGTSLATPLVSGVAALLASLQQKHSGQIDLAIIRRILLSSATRCDEQPIDECERVMFGRLNIKRAHFDTLHPLKGPFMSGAPEITTSIAEPPQAFGPAAEAALPPSLARSASEATVSPSAISASCGCGCANVADRYVYVIGDRIGYDFGTRVRQLSLQANADPDYPYSLAEPAGLLRYLLGSRKTGAPLNGNMHDAKSIHWVLYQDDCPRYVIQPLGDFSDAMYKALITFLVDTTTLGVHTDGTKKGLPFRFDDPDLDIRYDCLEEYFHCYSGAQDPLESGKARRSAPEFEKKRKEEDELLARFHHLVVHEAVEGEGEVKAAGRGAEPKLNPFDDLLLFMAESPSRASKVAIAGTLSNKRVTLANGRQVEVIHPELRGMSTWNTARLLQIVLSSFTGVADLNEADAWAFVARVVSRLYEVARNEGKSPGQRAANWAATAFLQQIRPLLLSRIFRDAVGGLTDAAVDDIQVRPATCQESGGEYDVEISLFSTANALRGLTVLAGAVDVSDIVPVTLSRTRVFNRRS